MLEASLLLDCTMALEELAFKELELREPEAGESELRELATRELLDASVDEAAEICMLETSVELFAMQPVKSVDAISR